MTRLQTLVEKNQPFAVMQYFQSLKSLKQEVNKEYELIFINSNNKVDYIILENEEIIYLKDNLETIKLIIKNKDGKIFEFNDFKNHKESLELKH
jgi:hypothetical protein